MSSFFNYDNAFFTFLGKICDIIFLSIIWAVVCIPIVTIGPANTALYYATVKVIRRERGYLFREFFKSFRLNFTRGAIMGIALTVIAFILMLDIYTSWTANSGSTSLNSIFFGVYIALAFFILSFSLYVFPVLSRFNMTMKQLIKAAAFMCIRHLFHTIIMLINLIAGIVVVLIFPLALVIIPAIVTLINSFIMERVLKKYMPQTENTEENSNKDEWYLE